MKGSIKKFKNGNRYDESTKYATRKLRRTGRTHREISRELGIGLGTAHIWTRGICVTPLQKEAIEKRRIQPYATEDKKNELRRRIKVLLKPYQYKEKYTQPMLLKKIKDFFLKYGRIPLKREFNSFAEFRRRFGSWNNAIRAAGFTPNKVIFSKKFTARDGHICDSFAEKIIDDYLSENGIIHERNVYYGDTKMSADFLVGDIRIEYFGLAGIKRDYDKNIEKKRSISEKNNYNLLEIYPSVLFAPGFKEFFIRNLRRWTRV